MSIRCPHCNFEMVLKGARPGQFSPRCQQCGGTFSLTIPQDPGAAPVVSMVQAGTTATVAPAPQAPATNDTPPGPSNGKPAPAPEEPSLNGLLGGYQIIQKLGEGGMGEVYLAKQLSLDRNVALKVLSRDLAADPQFVARFTREAFAAAQLTHHNIVQVHDIGADRSVHFYSMELVEGDNLGTTVEEAGKLDSETAAGYVLQAARGLKFAHDHGMIHRDVKPENLLLNSQGIVKVADLGLVKRANSTDAAVTGMEPRARRYQNTLANLSMGTPAYMAPEQAQDAAHVDSRADVYSLGCTLYDLLTGRPPFMGGTAIEIITKHQREPITPPEMIVRDVPKTLSSILVRMVAKRPQERYQSMGEVIRALEDFLGVAESGPFSPRQEHIATLETAVKQFHNSGWSVLQKQLVSGFFTACGLGTVLLWAMGHPLWATAILGFGVVTLLTYQILVGVTQRTHLFIKLRQLILGASLVDWISWIVAICAIVMLLVILEWFLPWLAASFGAVLVALGFHFTIDVMVARERERPLNDVGVMLRQLRVRGVDEMALRQFVCRFGGNRWEQFFEALFGYETKIQARQLWGKGDRNTDRRKFGAWRDPIIRWIERKQASRQSARQRKLIQQVEAQALAAKGMAREEAEQKAKETAEKVVETARRMRSGPAPRNAPTVPLPAKFAAMVKPSPSPMHGNSPVQIVNIINMISAEAMREGAEADQEETEEKKRHRQSWFRRRFGTPLDLLFGKAVRLTLAVIILIGFGLWWRQNKAEAALQAAAQVASSQREVNVTGDINDITRSAKGAVEVVMRSGQIAVERTGSRELQLPRVPRIVRLALSGWNAGVAGLILLVSVGCYGRLMSLTVLLAAAIALVGHWFELPVIGNPLPWMTAAVGAGLAFFALFFLRVPEGL